MSTIVVIVSVDWEGRSLLPENLQSMIAFRRKHADVPLQHFLNAAYYTRAGIDANATTRAIREVLLPEDDHGLHLHAWSSLLTASGVKTDDLPSFVKDYGGISRAADDWSFYPAESGYDTPIEQQFDVDELTRIIKTSQRILADQGFNLPSSFRAGGWMSGPKVQQALANNQVTLDCSAVDVKPVVRRFGEIPLCGLLRGLWPKINETSQPFEISTPSGTLWQLPNNACLVDYMPVEDTMAIFERNAVEWEKARKGNWFVSTGFHQETARVFLSRLDEVVTGIKRLTKERHWPVVFSGKPQDFLKGGAERITAGH